MCGICGILALEGSLALPPSAPERMIGVMRHRGPDEFGAWRNDTVFLGHARLSIIDPVDGQQPMADAGGRCRITYNGEVFNYLELRRELEGRGRAFRTHSDTEVIVNAWLEWGPACVERFNGQFAFALWDDAEKTLFLARDRFGICPLFVAEQGGQLFFASEIKALKACPGFRAEPDAAAMGEVLSYWANVPPRTAFTGVAQLPAGHVALVRPGRAPTASADSLLPSCLDARRYWAPSFLPADEDRRFVPAAERTALVGELRERLEEAVALRMRADVPVGSYLSGGLDSSAVAALAQRLSSGLLRTYGLGFDREGFDEREWQQMMVDHLGVDHAGVFVDQAEVARRLREVPWHAEAPLPRAAPTPLLLLSRHVRAQGCKVVMTGEGADEVFVGYDIHREAKVRAFWNRVPGSRARPALLSRLHPYQDQAPLDFLVSFYGRGLAETQDAFHSHRPRWNNTAAATFLCDQARAALATGEAERRLLASLPAEFAGWGPVARCQYLEMAIFMSGYLLSSQGDRMLMANSVEGRFPYLDHNLVEFAARIPVSAKLPGLDEKAMLKDGVADLVPAAIRGRHKHPFRAPGSVCFATPEGREMVEDFLLADGPGWDLWQRDKVSALVRKWDSGRLLSQRDDTSFVAVLSGRMLQRDFGPLFEERVAALQLEPGQLDWRD